MSFIENNNFSNYIKFNENVDDVINKIEQNFIMGYSAIDWGKNKILYTQKLSLENEKYLQDAKKFLEKVIISFPNLLKEKVILIGDALTNLSYEMTFEFFLLVFEQFLLIPQHLYIWFVESKKCINFSFENEVFFG